MTPEQYFSRLKAKLHMRTQLKELKLKGEYNEKIEENYEKLVRKLAEEEKRWTYYRSFSDYKKIKKMLKKEEELDSSLYMESIEKIKEWSYEAVKCYKQFCQKAIFWTEENIPDDKYIFDKLEWIDELIGCIDEEMNDGEDKGYADIIRNDKLFYDNYTKQCGEAYRLLRKINPNLWFYDKLLGIELEYIF